MILGKMIDNYYTLTLDGKEEVLREVNNRINNLKPTSYDDEYFERLVDFIVTNHDKTVIQTLESGLTGKENKLYKVLKLGQNKRKLEQWFEANAYGSNLLGEEIVSYFRSFQYREIAGKYKVDMSIIGLGKEIRKYIDEDFFINRIIDDIKVYSYYFDVITISDARFPKELDSIKNNFKDVYKINIKRPNFENNLNDIQRKHVTEVALDNYNDYDYILVNDGSINDLNDKIKQIIDKVI